MKNLDAVAYMQIMLGIEEDRVTTQMGSAAFTGSSEIDHLCTLFDNCCVNVF